MYLPERQEPPRLVDILMLFYDTDGDRWDHNGNSSSNSIR